MSAPEQMKPADLMPHLLKIIDFLSFEWNVYLAVCIAFVVLPAKLGGSSSGVLSKILLTLVAAAFCLYSFVSLSRYYGLLREFAAEIEAAGGEALFRTAALKNRVKELSACPYHRSLYCLHIPLDVLLIASVWLQAG
ncbi:MAG: hypothetical protein HN849_31580 [Victivallales bacterium]|jgi:hypothetical protein|nr:hypothetical protein [Victivallales bacterium]